MLQKNITAELHKYVLNNSFWTKCLLFSFLMWIFRVYFFLCQCFLSLLNQLPVSECKIFGSISKGREASNGAGSEHKEFWDWLISQEQESTFQQL